MLNVHFGHYSQFENLKGMTLLDMHSHSTFSDGRDKAEKCLKRAKKLGLNLCLTDHNVISGSKIACESGLSIPSIEVTSSEAYDFLFYFYTFADLEDFYQKWIKGHRMVEHSFLNYYRLRWSAEELLKKAKDHQAVVILPHPDAIPPKNSGIFIEGNKHFLKNIDAIEVINSTMSEASNIKAVDYARKWKKPAIGCSDAHLSRFIGAGVTAFESDTVETILEDIKKGGI